jgi:hypothetical protein
MKFSRSTSFRNTFLIVFMMLFSSIYSHGQVRILFDATKGEMAGNADWVVDYDQTTLGVGSGGAYITSPGHQSNPQQVPTPAQSGVTGSTPETYWSGGISAWGVDCAKKGYTVQTLPWNGRITYGDISNSQDLSHYDIYIVDEPNIVFTTAEKAAIITFVQNGGGLFMVSDHNNSDRNGDGWDSPNIWNDLFNNNTVAANPFGINFDLVDFSQTTTNISASATDSVIHGPMGNVTSAQWANGTTMSLDLSRNPTVKGVVFKAGTSPGSTNVMAAYGRYGSGKVAAIADSSPTDDGTGNPGCTLYNGYFADAGGNHQRLIMNMTIWLAHKAGALALPLASAGNVTMKVFPNPSSGTQFVSASQDLTNVSMVITGITGTEVWHNHLIHISKDDVVPFTLTPGCYFLRVVSDQGLYTSVVVVH